MLRLALLIVIALLPACNSVIPSEGPSGAGLCIALPVLADALATALQGPGVPDSVLITGAKVVTGIDKGCAK